MAEIPVSPHRALEELRSVLPIVRSRLADLVDRVESRMVAELADYRDGLPDLRASIQDQFEYILTSIAGTPIKEGLFGPWTAGRARAEQGIALHSVLEGYRITITELWQDVQAAALSQGTDPAIVVSLAGEMFGRLEEISRIAILAYQERAAELLIEREVERSATLEALFLGFLTGRDEILRAATRLELPLEGRFVAVVAASSGTDSLPDVYALLRRRGLGSAWRLTPDLKVGIVSLRENEVSVVQEVLEPLAKGPVGVSAVFRTLVESSQGVYLARLMMTAIPPGQAGVRQLDASPVAALLAASPDTSRTLIQAVLGKLLDLPEKARVPLLETLEHWLLAKGSVTDAARGLFCHPNTVRYRINRIEEVLGVELSDPEDLANVASAMQALRLFPQ